MIHKLFLNEEPINEFAKAGAFLGQLDYSKSAKHWGDCDALELDASGKLYKTPQVEDELFVLQWLTTYSTFIKTGKSNFM